MAKNNPVATPPGKGKLKVIILLVMVLILAVGLSVAGTLWFLSDDSSLWDKGSADSKGETFSPARYAVMDKALVTSVRNPGRQRYVQVHLAFEADQPEPLAAAEKHMPLLRNVLISELGQSEFMNLQSQEGRIELPERLLQAVNATLEQEGEPTIRRVLLRNFVVQ